MKKVFTKLLAVLMAVALMASLGLTVGATEMVRPYDEMDLEEALENMAPAQESMNEAADAEGTKGIFALQLQKGDIDVHLTAFLVEQNGSVYLVTDQVYGSYLMDAASTLTLKSSANGGYAQKATCLGKDETFVYLSASGLDAFTPLTAGTKIMKQGQLFVEQVNDGKVGKGLGYLTLELESMDYYKNADNESEYVFFNTGSKVVNLEIGAPIVESGTNTVFAIGSFAKHPEDGTDYPAYWTFAATALSEEFALNSSGGNSGGSTEGGNSEGGNGGNNGGGNSEGGNNGGGSDAGEEKGGFEFKPIYLLYIAIVAVVIFLIYRSNTQSGSEVGKPGTVAVEPTSPVQTGETLPLDPLGGNQGTLPLNSNFNPVPVMTAWQLRAVGGSFNGQTFPLSGTLRIGRAASCQIVFPDGTPGISSNHCEVALENGAVVLRDLGSSYGTFGKGGKLAPNSPCYLNPGDTFTLAQSQTFQLEAAGAVQTGGSIAVRDSQGREYRTGSGRMSFGRAAGSKVLFPSDDKAVSSNHCVLYRENGKLFLMDTGSTNGTFLSEGERLKPNVPYRIRKGMVFFLTNRKNTFVVTEE